MKIKNKNNIHTDNYSNYHHNFLFSFNSSGKDKNWDYTKLNTEFKNTRGTVYDLIKAVCNGHAVNGAWFKGTRSKANIVGVQLLLVDIDNTAYKVDRDGSPIKDINGKKIPVYSGELNIYNALQHPFIEKYCSAIYTTASHKPDWHKFRLVFALPKQIDVETYEALAKIVLKQFPHDPACKDAGRIFFGNTKAEILLCKPEKVLDKSFIDRAIALAKKDKAIAFEKKEQQKQINNALRSAWKKSGKTQKDLEDLVLDALGCIPPRQKGSGNYDDCLKVLTALVNEFGEAKGREIAECWSPTSPKDNWQPSTKRINANAVTIGTLFYIAQQEGWSFPTNLKDVIYGEIKKIDKNKENDDLKHNQDDKVYQKLNKISYGNIWKQINLQSLEYFNFKDLEKKHIYVVVSPKGTGKTNSIKPLVNKADNVYATFNRIGLGREESHKLGLTYRDELASFEGSLKVGFCVNSASQFNPRMLKNNGLYLMDEADQVFKFMFENICNKNGNRPQILKQTEAHINAALQDGYAIFMSADISDTEIEHLKKIAPPGCEVRVILNRYQPPKGNLKFDVSKTPDGIIECICKSIENGIETFVVNDFKGGVKGGKSVESHLKKIYPNIADRIVSINSDNSGQEDIKEYILNINNATKNTKVLIVSPSVISGISIENGHFKKAYGIFNGILEPNEGSQALGRVRGIEDITVWCKKTGVNFEKSRAKTPEYVSKYYQDNYQANYKELHSFDVTYNAIEDEWNSSWFDMSCKYATRQNLSMYEYRKRYREKFKSEGYTIIEIESQANKDLEEKLKSSWGSIKIDDAQAVESAKLIYKDSFEKLSTSLEALNSDQQASVNKTRNFIKYGDKIIDKIEYIDKITKVKLNSHAGLFLADNNSKWYKKLKQLFYLLDETNQVKIDDIKQETRQLKYGFRFAGDISWNSLKRECRISLGLDKIIKEQQINFDKWYESKDFEGLGKLAKKHHKTIKQTINLSVTKLSNAQIFVQLMQQLGLKVETKKVKRNGKTVRLRRICPKSLELSKLFIDHRYSVINDEFDLDSIVKSIENEELDLDSIVKSIENEELQQKEDDYIFLDFYQEPEKLDPTDPLNSEECLQDIADTLSKIETVNDFKAMVESAEHFTDIRLNQAFKKLNDDTKPQIREIASEIAREKLGIPF